jgi:hypothetical protein
VAETESINRASDGREIGRDGLGAVVAGEWRCRRISPTGSAGLGSRPGRRGRYAPLRALIWACIVQQPKKDPKGTPHITGPSPPVYSIGHKGEKGTPPLRREGPSSKSEAISF